MDRTGWELMRASDIPQGCCFVKKTGFYGYLRISDSSAKHFGLNPGFVYGVCYNGNMTAIPVDTMVWKVPFSHMEANRDTERNWEENVGCEESSPYLEDDPGEGR